MSKDFANRKSKSTSRGTPARAAPSRSAPSRAVASRNRKQTPVRSKRPQRTLLHGPSFVGGVVLGAILVLAGAYLPDLFGDTLAQKVAVKRGQPVEHVQFEFDERLRTSEVRTDPDAYAAAADPATLAAMEYLIQAASFRTRDDAESLRAQLLLIDLPARTNAAQVGDNPWYRVTVGPFLSQVEAGRAMTRLRELNLDAFLIKRAR